MTLDSVSHNDGFSYTLNKAGKLNALDRQLLHVYHFCRPMEMKDIGYGLFPWRREKHFYREFHANGWMAADRQPRKHGSGIKEYRGVFAENQVDPRIVDELMAFVRRCVGDGIRVYALRPPTCPEMVALEDRLSGFDESAFIQRLTAAGGTWLDVADKRDYTTFDDSHLEEESAVELSRLVARMIRAHERPQPGTSPRR